MAAKSTAAPTVRKCIVRAIQLARAKAIFEAVAHGARKLAALAVLYADDGGDHALRRLPPGAGGVRADAMIICCTDDDAHEAPVRPGGALAAAFGPASLLTRCDPG
jgi:hypothetical protein